MPGVAGCCRRRSRKGGRACGGPDRSDDGAGARGWVDRRRDEMEATCELDPLKEPDVGMPTPGTCRRSHEGERDRGEPSLRERETQSDVVVRSLVAARGCAHFSVCCAPRAAVSINVDVLTVGADISVALSDSSSLYSATTQRVSSPRLPMFAVPLSAVSKSSCSINSYFSTSPLQLTQTTSIGAVGS